MPPYRPTLVVCGFVVLVAAPAPDWSRRVGLDVWNATAARAALVAEEQRARDLDAIREDTRERLAVGEAVTARLVDGRLSVADAAAELEDLLGPHPGHRLSIRATFEGRSDRERYARLAVDRAARQVMHDPARRAAVVARLEAELAALYPPG